MDFLRKKVSKQKRRYNDDGFDLDLTYITEQIIAMGFPAERLEAVYRNPLSEVRRFLDARHKDHYMVYNLCSEREYETSKFDGQVQQFPFDDHNPPPFEMMERFCRSVEEWVSQDPANVAAVHCKAGKGRTGVMICAWLLWHKMWDTAEEALRFYGVSRTKDQKGVTIPSQARYVHYFAKHLERNTPYEPVTMTLHKVVLHKVPRFDVGGKCDPYFNIKTMEGIKIYSSKHLKALVDKKVDRVTIDVEHIPIRGDAKLEFFDKDPLRKEKMFHLWINTAFVDDYHVRLTKYELDRAHKDVKSGHFDDDFVLELFFDPVVKVQRGAPRSGGSSGSRKGSRRKAGASAGSRAHERRSAAGNENEGMGSTGRRRRRKRDGGSKEGSVGSRDAAAASNADGGDQAAAAEPAAEPAAEAAQVHVVPNSTSYRGDGDDAVDVPASSLPSDSPRQPVSVSAHEDPIVAKSLINDVDH